MKGFLNDLPKKITGKDPEFVRTYPADKGIEKFDKFIRMINW